MSEKNIQTFKIEINPEFKTALDLIDKTKKTVFITGKAGTGKSTLLQYFRENTKKNVVILAPTGVAALNVKGQTIHSFFHFFPNITQDKIRKRKPIKKLQNILKKVDAILIDEISMVRADLLDCIDEILRHYLDNDEPFGGLQLIFIGDLYQLPPVVSGKEEMRMFETYYESPYFFAANVLKKLDFEIIELEKIYRQKDRDFIELLNKIRNNSIEEKDIIKLNKRHLSEEIKLKNSDDFWITLTTTNDTANRINDDRINRLDTDSNRYMGKIVGDFESKNLPTLLTLELKIGAQVMLLNNDTEGRWVNGSLGKIIDINTDEENKIDILIVQLNNEKIVRVSPYKWEIYRYSFDKKTNKLSSDVVGSFTQYPIRLAWGITIHKAQGKTFDNIIVDIGNGCFAQGQTYVAISRCTSFDGLVLKKPISKRDIWTDFRIMNFLTNYKYYLSEKNLPLKEKIKLIESAINQNQKLKITYLKKDDTKSRREITPKKIGEMIYAEKEFIGVEAFCHRSNDLRSFRVDRILEIEIE